MAEPCGFYPGMVSLIGAGPGDPELITLKALRRLGAADAVVYDRLVADELLEYVPAGAELYDVGKNPGGRSARQEDINLLLVRLARRGLRVVRLKGGDPFVFGRGGEELLALARAGVPAEVVPGISSALAAPAAVGIPVTYRQVARSVTIATGHDASGGAGVGHNWKALAESGGTLVFLMAVENLSTIVRELLAHGRPAGEPAALVRSATNPDQVLLAAPLGTILKLAGLAQIQPPAVLVVGDVVELAAGWRTAVTEPSAGVQVPPFPPGPAELVPAAS